MKNAMTLWICLDGFTTHFTTNTTNTTNTTQPGRIPTKLVQWNFPRVCSCMDPVLLSSMLTETRTVDDVGQGFPEVGWYGKTCLNCLWILLVKSAVRILMCLDGFFTHFTTNTTQPHKIPTTTCAMKFSPCLFLHGFCSGLQHAERNKVQWIMLAKAFSRGWLVR